MIMAFDNFWDTVKQIGHMTSPAAFTYDLFKGIIGARRGIGDAANDLLNLSSNADTAVSGSDIENLGDASLADYLTGLFTSVGDDARAARDFNAKQAEISRKWQEDMSNSQYQRAVADLRKAGLNPILAASKGMTAGVPSGATASTSPAGGDTFSDILSILGGTISDILKVLTK